LENRKRENAPTKNIPIFNVFLSGQYNNSPDIAYLKVMKTINPKKRNHSLRTNLGVCDFIDRKRVEIIKKCWVVKYDF